MLWEKSPQLYKESYLEGKKFGTNRGQALGKEIAEALETGVETGDVVKDLTIAQIPSYEIRDKEIRMTLGKGKDEVPLLIKPDSCKADYSAFLEIKTGLEGNWSQSKVNKDDQITFYTTGFYVLTKKIPAAELIHAPTKQDEIGRPSLVGEIKRYPTTRTLLDIMKMQVRMKKAWREIGMMVESEII